MRHDLTFPYDVYVDAIYNVFFPASEKTAGKKDYRRLRGL
jgi:hypothetical protein